MTAKEWAQLHKDVFNNVQGRKLLGALMVQFVLERNEGADEWERGIAEGRHRLIMEMLAAVALKPEQFPEYVAGTGDIFGEYNA